MSLYLYDTATRSAREFTPLREGAASIYLCGATVQGIPHIGHVRSGLNFDVLGRWLTRKGLSVTLVRNVTDIDDKILTKARQNNKPWWEWAAIHERAFSDAYRLLGCTPPSIEPRATGHVTQMVDLMRRLIDAGHAYASSGNVYFDVASYPDYCSLSRQKLDDVHQGELGTAGKRDPRDFTLWKAAKPGEPSWPTPWGDGRPGWHLECSAMAETYLGPEFDIHGGGIDLIFPHHENEQAQSKAAGGGFAQYWMHNGWVTLSGEKMSKSLGNTVSIPVVLDKVRAVELRYYLTSAHYRSTLEYSEAALDEAVVAYRRIEGFLRRAAERVGTPELDPTAPLNSVFERNLDDDLGTPGALAALHNTVREGNAAIDAGDREATATAAASVRAMTDVLGIDPYSPTWASTGGDDSASRQALSTLVSELLEERTRARAERDFAASDAVRDRLAAAGIVVEDTPDGPSWSLKG